MARGEAQGEGEEECVLVAMGERERAGEAVWLGVPLGQKVMDGVRVSVPVLGALKVGECEAEMEGEGVLEKRGEKDGVVLGHPEGETVRVAVETAVCVTDAVTEEELEGI